MQPRSTDLVAVQDDVRAGLTSLLRGTPFRNGKLFTVRFNAALDQELITHSLGGEAKGAVVVDVLASPLPAAAPVIWRVPVAVGRRETHVAVTTSEPCTVQVWVWR